MSLSAKAIDRLFERLAATYTNAWVRQFDAVPIADVKTAWAHELARTRLEAIAWALENLPSKCPNVIEFRNLCREAPLPPAPAIEAGNVSSAERVRAEVAAMKPLLDLDPTQPRKARDYRAWARRIVDRHASGERVAPIAVSMARTALRQPEA